eukprot:scaffold23143_cov92-Skeletonema_dohrnii-CCMP3373.AAC.4
MERAGLVCGLMAVLEHLKNTRAHAFAVKVLIVHVQLMCSSNRDHHNQEDCIKKCTKLLEVIQAIADSLKVTFGGVITSRQHNIVLDRLVNEAMDEQRNGALSRREIKPCRNIS